MKKILLFVLMISSIFILSSCKKSEPVGREMDDFYSDFKFDDEQEYKNFDEITKDQTPTNKFKYLGITFFFNCTTKKKVYLKNISYNIYNDSETNSIWFVKQKAPSYEYYEDEKLLGVNISIYDELLHPNYEEFEVKPKSFVSVNYDINVLLKKNTQIRLFFRIDPNFGDDDFKTTLNTIKNDVGVSNFKVDYNAYIKI